MPTNQSASLPRVARLLCLVALLAVNLCPAHAQAQTRSENPYYARTNTFGIFGAYSGDSSHILLGDAENRELLSFGVSYNRRLILNHIVNWQYSGEFLPVALESDPTGKMVIQETSPIVGTITQPTGPLVTCAPQTTSFTFTDPTTGKIYSYTETMSCVGRRWTIGEAMSPVGFQWNFRPRHKLQPFLDGHGGYMYSTKPVPTIGSGSFNFTFDFGAGFELYRSKSRSIRAEYRFHHISNHSTAQENPGIDNGLVQVTYAFGR